MMGWFPEQYRETFYAIKAVLSLFGAILLILHMSHVWHVVRPAQCSRYLVLLGYALVTAYASMDYVRTNAPVELINLMNMILTLGLIASTAMSMRNWSRSQTRP